MPRKEKVLLGLTSPLSVLTMAGFYPPRWPTLSTEGTFLTTLLRLREWNSANNAENLCRSRSPRRRGQGAFTLDGLL